MPHCPNCGNENPAEARFCASCGQQFAASEAQPQYAAAAQSGPQFVTPQPEQPQGWQAPAGTYPGQRLGLPPYGPNSLAEPGTRLLARIIDALIVGAALIVLFIVSGVLAAGTSEAAGDDAGMALFGTSFFLGILGALAYEVVMIAVWGQTLGKMAMKIKAVKSATGEIPGWGPSFIRWIVPAVMGFVPFLPLLDALWLLWDENRQCLHDKAANTLVVRLR